MQSRTSVFVVASTLVAALVVAVPAMAQSAASHDHAAHAAHAGDDAQAQAPAQRWAADAPLRAGMRNLGEATETLSHYQMGHLDDTRRDRAVTQIDAAIKDMFANCKLAPAADAALHGLLAKFILGANAARAGHFTEAELVPMQEALSRYPQLFDDAGWNPSGD